MNSVGRERFAGESNRRRVRRGRASTTAGSVFGPGRPVSLVASATLMDCVFSSLFAEIGRELADIAIAFGIERAKRATDGSSGNVVTQMDIAIAQVAAARTALHGQVVGVATPGGERIAWFPNAVVSDIELSRFIARRKTAGFHW